MTLDEKKEAAQKVLELLSGLNYAEAYSILNWAQDALAKVSVVSVHSPEALQDNANKRQDKDELIHRNPEISS